METSSRRTRTGAVCLGSTILAGFAAYGLLIILELILAQHSSRPESLPPPGDRGMLLAVFAVALVSGVLITLRWHRNRHPWSDDSVRGLSAFTATATAVVVIATLITHFALAQSYLHSVPAGIASRSTLLDAGHEACNWLDARHWGHPSDLPGIESPEESAALAAVYDPHSIVAISTRILFEYYSRYLDRQNPGPLTQADRIRLTVAFVAWYKMCPFQQWVHRPVSGSGH
jgi:hypothetical protein